MVDASINFIIGILLNEVDTKTIKFNDVVIRILRQKKTSKIY